MNPPIQQKELLALCEEGVQAALAAGADEAEVFATSHTESEANLEKNDLNQIRRVEETTFGIRVVKKGALGFCTSNQPGSLAGAAKEAVTLASLSPADDHNGIPEGTALPDTPAAVDPALLALTVPELTEMCMNLMAQTRAIDSRLTIDSGSIGITHATQAIANSKGVRAAFEKAGGGGYLFGMCVDGDTVGSFAYDGDVVQHATQLQPSLETAFARFAEKCAGALGAQKGESFRGSILLPPDAVQEFLLGNLMGVLGANAVRKGQSPLADKVGTQIASELFELIEEGAGLPNYRLAPFDREGTARTPTPLITKGALNGFLFDSYEARAAGTTSTGNAAGGASSMPTVGSGSLSVGAGTTPLAEMMNIEKGVYVTRFSGSTNPITGDFSGVIKGGFLLHGGEKVAIDETTMAGNLYDCLKNISAVSKERRALNGSVLAPTIRIDDVSITAA